MCTRSSARIIKRVWLTCGRGSRRVWRIDFWDAEQPAARERETAAARRSECFQEPQRDEREVRTAQFDLNNHILLCSVNRDWAEEGEKVQIPRISAWEWEAGSWPTEESSTVCLAMAGNSCGLLNVQINLVVFLLKRVFLIVFVRRESGFLTNVANFCFG